VGVAAEAAVEMAGVEVEVSAVWAQGLEPLAAPAAAEPGPYEASRSPKAVPGTSCRSTGPEVDRYRSSLQCR